VGFMIERPRDLIRVEHRALLYPDAFARKEVLDEGIGGATWEMAGS
jgi:hypothetical protein